MNMFFLKRLQKFRDDCFDADVNNVGFAMSIVTKDKSSCFGSKAKDNEHLTNNLMNKEEKAKEYAKQVIGVLGTNKILSSNRIANDYLAGYTQAEQDLSAQSIAYKEALSSLWSDIHFTDISKEQIMNRIGSLIQPKP